MKYNRQILIKQHDITDCGAACLASICAYYGLILPISRIRQYAFTEKKGTNILGMIKASEKLGLTAKGVKATPEALNTVEVPVIAHIVVDGKLQHFITIYKIAESNIEYMDPADGDMHKITFSEFIDTWTGVLILIKPNTLFHKGNMKKSNWDIFATLIRPHISTMLKVLMGAIICSLLGLSIPLYIGKVLDSVLDKGNLSLLNALGIGIIVLVFIRITLSLIKSLMALSTSQIIDKTLVLGYYNHILRLPQFFFDTMRVGEIISRVNDAFKIRTFINDIAVELVVNSMILFSSVILMLFFSWKLTLISLSSAPLFMFIFRLFNKRNKKYQRNIMEKTAEFESQLVESISGITTIKQFNIYNYVASYTKECFAHMLKGIYLSSKIKILTSNALDLTSSIITITILWIGSYYIIQNKISIGTLMVFYSLVSLLLSPIAILINSNRTIQDALIATDRLYQILDLETEPSDEGKKTINKEDIGDILFKNVTFQYGSRKPLFNSINLQIEVGKTTAIVGESGSGKTTITKLLQKLYPIQSGQICIGKHDITTISSNCLRQVISIVPQKIELFSGTIISNIALGDSNPNTERINNIIRELGLKEFIEDLPLGLETKVNEQGITFSGGEKQRIAIARALYRKPDIIIFDEATSSLDSTSEQYVKQVIKRLRQQHKTIIVIAHRLSTIKEADKILVIDKGKLTEEGTFNQLVNKTGVFQKLWQLQFGKI